MLQELSTGGWFAPFFGAYLLLWSYPLCYLKAMATSQFYFYMALSLVLLSVRFENPIFSILFYALCLIPLVFLILKIHKQRKIQNS